MWRLATALTGAESLFGAGSKDDQAAPSKMLFLARASEGPEHRRLVPLLHDGSWKEQRAEHSTGFPRSVAETPPVSIPTRMMGVSC